MAVTPQVALLRLEMAAELPTPADDLDARRSLQLQLLTRRNDPPPAQTWGQDTAAIFATPFDPGGSTKGAKCAEGVAQKVGSRQPHRMFAFQRMV
jgi:hypothetical protein